MHLLGYIRIILKSSLLKEVSTLPCLVEVDDSKIELIKVEPSSFYQP